MKKAIIVIDPVVSSDYLKKSINELGYCIIQIFTYLSAKSLIKDEKANQNITIFSKKNIDNDIKKIKLLSSKYNIITGIYGDEISVEYADKIFNILFPETANHINNSSVRFNKFDMQNSLSSRGINSIKQKRIKGTNLSNLIDTSISFFNKHNRNIVIKPSINAGGSIGVFSPKNSEEIKKYFENNEHFLIKTNSPEYVLQERVYGNEFLIDISSYDGQHVITGIAQYKKTLINGIFEYNYIENININSTITEKIKNYSISIINALGVKTGLSHLEIMINDENIYLIELNPRISGLGGAFNKIQRSLYKIDQVIAFINLLENKKNTLKEIDNNTYATIFILNNKIGKYKSINKKELLQDLKADNELCIFNKKNQYGNCTKELSEIIGIIILKSCFPHIINNDIRLLNKKEETGEFLRC
ncbi:ATP-grasp domain-containing protein [Francisella sp. 19X1-34]|uniref:ATP-grasp domain-containing protein n=1 Tax=Francisella sp. 19X1-34 TaxID=3087177 RepID=UPI002E36424B|nr:ATP-grasp domain-containing protein [Francisella sp. 19X1-34]MED7789661.1 ATP-grasp domain-containing protein [Francisella sp. 19X1-34]